MLDLIIIYDVFEGSGVNACKGSRSGSLLCFVGKGSLGNDASGGDHDNGPVELSLEVRDELLTNFVVGRD